MKISVLLIVALTIIGCNPSNGGNRNRSIKDGISFSGTNKINIVYFAKMSEKTNQKTTEITDSATIKLWLTTLSKIPKKGPGMMVKMSGDAPKYIITFYKNTQPIGTLRILGSCLDAPADEGYDFYSGGVDTAFVSLVEKLFP